MPRPKVSAFTRDNTAYLALARAKKAATAAHPKAASWWTNCSREEFQQRLAVRRTEILNSASDATRSLGKAI